MHDESTTRRKVDDKVHDGALPAYLLDRDETTRAKVIKSISNKSFLHVCNCMIKAATLIFYLPVLCFPPFSGSK